MYASWNFFFFVFQAWQIADHCYLHAKIMQPQSADSNPYPALLVTKNLRPDDPPSKNRTILLSILLNQLLFVWKKQLKNWKKVTLNTWKNDLLCSIFSNTSFFVYDRYVFVKNMYRYNLFCVRTLLKIIFFNTTYYLGTSNSKNLFWQYWYDFNNIHFIISV